MKTTGVGDVVERVRERLGGAPVYVSIDIDVLDPAHAPGTGTPEAGGLTSRELLGILRGLAGLNVVGADIVEVAPAYDHAEITAMAASPRGLRAARALRSPALARHQHAEPLEPRQPRVRVLLVGALLERRLAGHDLAKPAATSRRNAPISA